MKSNSSASTIGLQITHRLSTEFQDFKKETKQSLVSLNTRSQETENKLVSVQQQVDDTSDTLVLSSAQVTVELPSSEGPGKQPQPMKLQDVVVELNDAISFAKKSLQDQLAQINSAKQEISLKADATVSFDIDALGSRLLKVEKQVAKDSEQGVGEIRRQCEELTSSIESIQIELAEKVSRDNAELIVHKKYEDIVQYLHEALQASKADEEMFNKKADELRDAVKRLGISKADRFEIASMQETVMKTESIVNKLKNAESNAEKDRPPEDMISRSEILELLTEKLDRSEFESWQKLNRRRTTMTSESGDTVIALGPNYIKGEGMLPRAASATGPKSLPQLQEETTPTKSSKGSSTVAIEGKGLASPNPKADPRGRFDTFGGGSDNERLATIRVPMSGGDGGGFMKLSTLQAAGRSILPQDLHRSSNYPSLYRPEALQSSLPEYEFGVKPDMSFVGASVVGAGFNTKSSTILKGPLLSSPDVESKTVS